MADETDRTRPLAATFPVGSRTDGFLRGAIARIAADSDADTAQVASAVMRGERPLRDLTETSWMISRLAEALTDRELADRLTAAREQRTAGDDPHDQV